MGFIGLGRFGGKLAGSMRRSEFDLLVHELDPGLGSTFQKLGANIAVNNAALARAADVMITCLLFQRHSKR